MAEIILPQMSVGKMDDLRMAIQSIGKCVEADIQMKEVVNIVISWPGDRPEVGQIIRQLIGIKQIEISKPTIQPITATKKTRRGRRKKQDEINPIRLSESQLEKNLSPMGS